MLVLVQRASHRSWESDDPPDIPDAQWCTYTCIRRFTVRTPEAWNKHHFLGKTPYGTVGTNWRTTTGGIAYDEPDWGWAIEMHDWCDILDFVVRHGRCVVQPPDDTCYYWQLTIYDAYLE